MTLCILIPPVPLMGMPTIKLLEESMDNRRHLCAIFPIACLATVLIPVVLRCGQMITLLIPQDTHFLRIDGPYMKI